MSAVATVTREVYKRELLPSRALWWLAAAGMRDWYRVLAKRLADHVDDPKKLLSELSIRMFERRWEAGGRPSGSRRDVALLMSSLYRVDARSAWIFAGLGGPPRGLREHARARWLLGRLDANERWTEVATHLGE